MSLNGGIDLHRPDHMLAEFTRIGDGFKEAICDQRAEIVLRKVIKPKISKCGKAKIGGSACQNAEFVGFERAEVHNPNSKYTSTDKYINITWSQDIEFFKDKAFKELFKFKREIVKKISERSLTELTRLNKELSEIDNKLEKIAVEGAKKSLNEKILLDSSYSKEMNNIFQQRNRIENKIKRITGDKKNEYEVQCEILKRVNKRYGEPGAVSDRSKQACASYHFDAYVFFKSDNIVPFEFRHQLPGFEQAWDEAPLNTFVLVTRHQRPTDEGSDVVFTPWRVEKECPVSVEEVVNILKAMTFQKPRPTLISRNDRCDPCCWWCWVAFVVAGVVALAVIALLVVRLFYAEARVQRLTDVTIQLEIEIEETQQALADARADLAAARRSQSASAAEIAALQLRVDQLEDEVARMRARSGLDKAPCMRRDPADRRPQPAFLFDVALDQRGLRVDPRHAGLEDLGRHGLHPDPSMFDRYLSLSEFERLAEPIYDLSVERDCRYTVVVERGRHDSARAYQEQMDAVTQRFYIYERR